MTRILSQSYEAVHAYLRKNYKKTGKCEFCKESKNRTEWAKKTESNYTREREDYHELCVSCHRLYDFTEEQRKNMSDSHKGLESPHKYQPVRVSKEFPSIKHAMKELNLTREQVKNALSKTDTRFARGYRIEVISEDSREIFKDTTNG